MNEFPIFLFVGFVAQAIDGALGMAYGVISSTVLLSFGVSPAMASASVHTAEVFTTGAAAASHAVNRNVRWRLFLPLAVGGALGGALGAFVLTSVDRERIKPFIILYLAAMGVLILVRARKERAPRPFPLRSAAPLRFAGGFLDSVGGGGWGPSVTSAMVASGASPRS